MDVIKEALTTAPGLVKLKYEPFDGKILEVIVAVDASLERWEVCCCKWMRKGCCKWMRKGWGILWGLRVIIGRMQRRSTMLRRETTPHPPPGGSSKCWRRSSCGCMESDLFWKLMPTHLLLNSVDQQRTYLGLWSQDGSHGSGCSISTFATLLERNTQL